MQLISIAVCLVDGITWEEPTYFMNKSSKDLRILLKSVAENFKTFMYLTLNIKHYEDL